MGNDCSERVCQFGLAHVDTPKGDLDNSGRVLDARYPVIENNFVYPYGTTEAYPEMVDSNLNEIQDSAHYYMECSNKGTCDRKKGTCKCYPGYDGASCQRASCPGFPNSCSGHGVCKTIQQLANADNGNIYELWDRHMTMGCECDAGFYGPDCSKRRCKTGVDPLYLDDSATIKYPVWNVATLSHTTTATGVTGSGQTAPKDLFYNGMSEAAGPGYWALRFFDSNGEDWLTGNIPGGASCDTVKQALYDIPNNVIPADSVSCTIVTAGSDGTPVVNPTGTFNEENDLAAIDYLGDEHNRPITYKFAFWETISDQIKFQVPTDNDVGGGGLPKSWVSTANQDVIGFVYRLKFFGNPGALREPEIEIYLDGDRPTLAAVDHVPAETAYSSTLITKVWTDGMQGEDKDYFADHCDGVTVNVRSVDLSTNTALQLPKRKIHYLGMTTAESLLLKSCLGGADFSDHNNIDSYDWDYGSRKFPHIIKLVRSVTSATDGGHYVALIYKPYYTDAPGGTNLPGNGDTTGYFELVNPWLPLNTGTTDATPNSNDYEVYTTKGVLALVSEKADAFFGFGEKEMYTFNIDDELSRETNVADDFHHYGSLSCEFVTSTGPNKQIKYRSQTHGDWDKVVNSDGEQEEATKFEQVESAADWDTSMRGARLCLNKTDIIIPLAIPEDGLATANAWNEKNETDITEPTATPGANDVAIDTILNYNPPEINMYTVEKIYTKDYVAAESEVNEDGHHGVYTDAGDTNKLLSNMWRNVIKTDLSTNWGTGANYAANGDDSALFQGFRIYKFHPAAASTYEYVAQCSNRGLCDANSGVCNCFPGYGNDNCDEQNALAV